MSGPSQSDWDKPFPERFLACTVALVRLDHALSVIGMSGNDTFKRLQNEVIHHGGVTFNDMQRTAQANKAST